MLKIITSIILVFIATMSFAAKINFITSLSKAKKLAKEENKIIFVDVMADWCLPCKLMINDMEKDEKVVAYFNENFINLKINERHDRHFIKTFNIGAYPTILFLDKDANEVERMIGYKDVSHVYLNANRINGNNAMIQSYSDLDNLKEFDEQSFIDELSTSLAQMSKTEMNQMLNSLVKLGMPYSKPILYNYPTYISPPIFGAAYKDLDGAKDKRLTEKYIISYILTDDSFQNTIEMKTRSNELAEIIGMQSVKVLSYALAYREFNLFQHLGLANEKTKLVNAKNLLNNYPETSDTELLSLAFTEIVKTTVKEDFDYYKTLQKTFLDMTTSSQEYTHYDILSVLQYANGHHDQYSLSIAKANELARSKAIKFSPLLKDLRVYLD